MSTPSTKIIPARISRPSRAPDSSISSASPLRPLKIRSGSIPTASASRRVQAQALVIPVDRHHVARAGQVEHQLQLLLPSVTRGVDRRVGGGHHLGADLEDPVDRLVHRALVAGDRRGREDHRVAGVELDVGMVRVGHAPQRRQRLALAPGRDRDHLVVREGLDLARRDQQPVRSLGDARGSTAMLKFLRIERPTSATRAVELRGRVDHLLDPMHVRGERGDDDPAGAAGEQLEQRRADARLRRRHPRPVGVGRVAAQARARPPAPAPRAERRRLACRPRGSGRTCSRR